MDISSSNSQLARISSGWKPPRPALPPRFLYRLRKFTTAYKKHTGKLPSTGEAIRILRGLDASELFGVACNPTVGRAWRAAALDRLNRLELERQKPGLREREKRLRAAFGLVPVRVLP